MKKLKIEDLAVVSFETSTRDGDPRGTVRGHESVQACTDNTLCYGSACTSHSDPANCTDNCTSPYGCGTKTSTADLTFCDCDTNYGC